ncbi:MAG: tetratricopeptide repeat protein, partial [Rhodoferax sp.]|nr:tetratricopeptide repeat protein [Rhodoferax sp.]
MTKPARNDPCPCGSGKKYKACCLARDGGSSQLAVSSEQRVATLLQQAIGLHQAGQLSQARALYQQILTLDSKQPDALHLLGLIEHQQGKSQAGLQHIQQAIEQRPADATFHFNLANMQQDLGQFDAAITSFELVLKLQPDNADACVGLGTALKAHRHLDDAIASYKRGVAIQPDCVDAHYNLGNAFMAQNQFESSLASFRNVLRLQPDHSDASGNLLFTLQHLVTISPDEVFSAHLSYAERFEAPLKPFWQPHLNNRDPGRRLKVGYVSGDFRRHAVAYFIEPILVSHDKAVVELYGYANHALRDAYTERIAAHMDHWLVCNTLSDDQLAQRIRADGIDILVDLSGHTALHRLLVFARKPAPVQATYVGYPDTTGLSSMDYRISDPWLDPPDLTERYHSEKLVRIPGGMAFRPDADAPDVNALPA